MARRVDPETLAGLMQQTPINQLGNLFVVSGDEPLLVIETTDTLREAARKAGYGDRITLIMDARSDWSELDAALQNVSLFGDLRLVSLSLPSGKPGKTGSEALQRLAALQTTGGLADTMVIITLPKLDKATRTAKWAQQLFEAACTLEPRSVDRHALPQWIGQRLARQGQRLGRNELEWMADKVEGNLLAAHQEILKLGLLFPEGELSAAQVQQAVLDVARYDVFSLREAMLNGQARRALTILRGLQAEGEALPLVFWATGEEIRVLSRLATCKVSGLDLTAEMKRQRIFGAREQGIHRTLNRIPTTQWPALLQHAHDIDRLIKGLKTQGRLGDAWEELGRLVVRVASEPKRPAR